MRRVENIANGYFVTVTSITHILAEAVSFLPPLYLGTWREESESIRGLVFEDDPSLLLVLKEIHLSGPGIHTT